MHKRWTALALASAILISSAPKALALDGQNNVPNSEDLQIEDTAQTLDTTYSTFNWDVAETRGVSEMHMSEKGINFIKQHEGFAPYAAWDYAQWSIGYGSACNPGDYPYGITEEEADWLLRKHVSVAEGEVRRFMRNKNVTFNQHQYDAMVIFTYGVGSAWTTGCRITRWILNPTTDLEFVDAMGAWCHAGGDVLVPLTGRRVLEAKIFLYGDYEGNKSPDFHAVVLNANGGKFVGTDDSSDIFYYYTNQPYGSFPYAQRNGYTIAGWYDKDGKLASFGTTAKAYGTLTAKWTKTGMSFYDIYSTSWYYKYVKEAVDKNWLSGTTAYTFSPDGEMTRAMLVNVLYRIAGKPAVTGTNPFYDVQRDAWYADSVTWAYQNNIVSGNAEDSFAPNDPISREQLYTILYRYAQFKGYQTDKYADLDSFADSEHVSDYAKNAMEWAIGTGLLSGVKEANETFLMPVDSATRAQAATILVNFARAYNVK